MAPSYLFSDKKMLFKGGIVKSSINRNTAGLTVNDVKQMPLSISLDINVWYDTKFLQKFNASHKKASDYLKQLQALLDLLAL